MRFGILKKVLIIFLFLSLTPLLAMVVYTLVEINSLGQEIIETNKKVIVTNTLPLLNVRVRNTAESIEKLLEKCSEDVNLLSSLPQSRGIHRNFFRNNSDRIWYREGTRNDLVEISKKVNLYREITFVNKKGIVVLENAKYPRRRIDLTKPYRGKYGFEDYFQQAVKLKGKIYVSRLLGYHIKKEEQLKGTDDVENSIGGAEYSGIIRFAKAIIRKGELRGVVSLALDHRHLMERTQHIVPLSKDEVVFPKYNSGNFAFAFDCNGWIITHPKFWYIRGVEKDTGKFFNTYSGNFNQEKLDKGLIPLNIVNIHTEYTKAAKMALKGKSGIIEAGDKENPKLFAYAPIKFSHGDYKRNNCFGAVIYEAKSEIFKRAVSETTDKYEGLKSSLFKIFFILTGITLVLSVFLSYLYVNNIKKILLQITAKINDIISGDYSTQLSLETKDEFEILGDNINKMGQKILENEKTLKRAIYNIEEDISETKRSETSLRKHLDVLRNFHSHKDIFNDLFYFQKEYIHEKIVRCCVDIIGFERSELYLPDVQNRLKCVKIYNPSTGGGIGMDFSVDENSIQYDVFINGHEVVVKDISSRRIDDTKLISSRREQSYSFAVFPVSVSGTIYGVLVSDHITMKHKISPHKEKLLRDFVNEASHALEKSIIFEEFLKKLYSVGSLKLLSESTAQNIRKPLTELTLMLEDIFNHYEDTSTAEKALEAIDYMAETINNLSFFAESTKERYEADISDVFKEIGKDQRFEIEMNFGSGAAVIVAYDKLYLELTEIIGKSAGQAERISIIMEMELIKPDTCTIYVKGKNTDLKGASYTHNPFHVRDGSFIESEEKVEGTLVFFFSNVKSK